jgi:hypothetical protein
MHWQQGGSVGGENLHCIPRTYPKSQGGACAFLLHFWLLGGVVYCIKSVWPILVTGLTGLVEPVWPVFGTVLTGLCLGVAFVQGVCICVGGALVCFGGLCSLLEHGLVSDVSNHCPCLRGPRLFFFKWFCSLRFLGFRSLVGVSFICFFPFSFLSGYYMCVLSMHSSRGRLRTMYGSRTVGWSLPDVMSDWQRCVDWFLAKYCRCRLCLD